MNQLPCVLPSVLELVRAPSRSSRNFSSSVSAYLIIEPNYTRDIHVAPDSTYCTCLEYLPKMTRKKGTSSCLALFTPLSLSPSGVTPPPATSPIPPRRWPQWHDHVGQRAQAPIDSPSFLHPQALVLRRSRAARNQHRSLPKSLSFL